jgi:hypothetical protein
MSLSHASAQETMTQGESGEGAWGKMHVETRETATKTKEPSFLHDLRSIPQPKYRCPAEQGMSTSRT